MVTLLSISHSVAVLILKMHSDCISVVISAPNGSVFCDKSHSGWDFWSMFDLEIVYLSPKGCRICSL